MNIKNYFLVGMVLSASSLIADVPVGKVQSEVADQASSEETIQQRVVSSEQSMEVRSVGGIEEVVVTAQKREESLQETPIAITAITSSTIDDLDIKNVVDMAGISPNVMLVETPSNNTSATIAMRGGVTINPAITWEPTVGVYLDGVYLGKTQGAIFDVVDLERVEILRGPQGTLYGRNTLGGAINLITKKPNGSGVETKFTLGNYGLAQAQFITDFEFGDRTYGKLVLNNKKRDGFVSVATSPFGAPQGVVPPANPAVDELDTIDSRGFRFSISKEMENSSLDIAVDYNDQNNIPPFAQLGNTIPNWSTAFGVGASAETFGLKLWPIELFTSKDREGVAHVNENVFEKSKVKGLSLTYSYDLSFGTLKAIYADRSTKWSDNLDLDGGPFPIANTSRYTDYSSETFELQLAGERGNLNYVLGYYSLKDDAYTSNPQSFFGGMQTFAQNYSGTGDSEAIYAQLEFAVTDKTDVTVGVRSTDEDKEGFKEYVGVISANGQGSFDDTTGTFIVSHDISDSANLYFKVADGFKAGGFNAESSNPFAASTPYAPETVQSTEIGFKGMYADNRLMVNVAYFDNEHEDMQISYFTADAAAASEVINNSADISGIEIETTAYLNESTKLMINYGSLDADFTGGAVASDGFVLEQFPYAPEHTLYVSLEKDFGAYRMRLDHSRISEHAIFPYNGDDPRAALTNVDSRGITDLRLFMDPADNINLTFWIKNLSDKSYIVNNIPFGPGFGQLTLDYYGAPRTVGFDVRYRF